jgi:redox-sensitive bicupin YhaK (pirin superfamily)
MSQRTIKAILQAPTNRHGPGLVTRDAGESVLGEDLDPFIMVSLYDMAGPTFPPHPHAGFAVATYILPDSEIGFINQDTLGNKNPIPPGALHVTVAGSGVQHEEQPIRSGGVAKGFQIWIDLKNGTRQVAPHAVHLAASDVPVITREGATVRVVQGDMEGAVSPAKLATNIRILDVALEAGARVTLPIPARENAFAFVLKGAVEVNGSIAREEQLVRTAPDGDEILLTAGPEGARLTVFAGEPFRQPRAQRGPFVASDPAELQSFMNAFANGRMGSLVPFAEQRAAG